MRLLAGLDGAARGDHRPGRRRPADGDRHAAAAARGAGGRHGRRVAAVVLAAGRSTRMGGPNKLLAEIARQAAGAHRRRGGAGVARQAGHRRHRPSARREVEAALAGLPVTLVHNPDFARGPRRPRCKTGIAAVPAEADGAIVCLGDMPQVDAGLIDRLIAAFDPERGALVVVPTFEGKRGNPVLWSRRFFPDLMAIEGDVGARHLIGRYPRSGGRSAGRRPRRRSSTSTRRKRSPASRPRSRARSSPGESALRLRQASLAGLVRRQRLIRPYHS